MPGSTTTAALDRAVHRYRSAPVTARALIHGRAFLSDLAFVDRYVPRHGFIVDLGCGQGLFANLLTEAAPNRRVLGIDLDARKIGVARSTIQGRESLRFEVGDILHETPPKCDAIAIIDVLYLLSPADQEAILRKAATALVENAPLIVKAQERAPGARYALTYTQELVAAALGLARGGARGFHFQARDDARAMFERAGFLVDVIEMPHRPYTDVVYLARKAPAP
ncbi:MAG TPA: class I SAM-dependent methyltransferase [Candidatus Limnocylindria bacterium]|nr:class I SAM-dependent methyltransferase [Candidatus Limnocylindria bacterium]